MSKPLPISVRFFALAFIPTAAALLVGFGWFRHRIEDSVRQGLEQSLTQTQQVQTGLRLEARQQRLHLLSGLAENAALKAGLTLWRDVRDAMAKQTVEDQLLEMAGRLDADLVAMRDAEGIAVAAVARAGASWKPLTDLAALPLEKQLAPVNGRLSEMTALPVNNESENLGMLVVGKNFNAAAFHPEAVLLRDGNIVEIAGLQPREPVASLLAACGAGQACAISIDRAPYLALPVDARLLDPDYRMWTLHSVEKASSQLTGAARGSLQLVLAGLLLAALVAAVSGARAVVRPLTAFIDRLRQSEQSGVLTGDFPENSSTREVNELAHAFNLAAHSVADSQRRLDQAYLEITQTMAQTLDARDPYTAGHSLRVSDYAVAIAEAMKLPPNEVSAIRVGATLHDIGKIGIPDAVLQKPGVLSLAEYEVIKQHPVIGKRILEGVAKFRDYLAIVELHHENQDGTGYPWGLRGEKIPLGARIVHVVDAYDAMTTTRPYRHAMPPEQAQEVLQRHAGSQFDPAVVEVFLRLVRAGTLELPAAAPFDQQLAALVSQLEPHPDGHVTETLH